MFNRPVAAAIAASGTQHSGRFRVLVGPRESLLTSRGSFLEGYLPCVPALEVQILGQRMSLWQRSAGARPRDRTVTEAFQASKCAAPSIFHAYPCVDIG